MSPASYQTAPPRDDTLMRAGNGTRTRDPNLGKVVLYQLSYSRVGRILASGPTVGNQNPARFPASRLPSLNGGEGDRTPDLVNAIHALSQLSYAPIIFSRPHWKRPQSSTAS
jgi:hypothetical protein